MNKSVGSKSWRIVCNTTRTPALWKKACGGWIAAFQQEINFATDKKSKHEAFVGSELIAFANKKIHNRVEGKIYIQSKITQRTVNCDKFSLSKNCIVSTFSLVPMSSIYWSNMPNCVPQSPTWLVRRTVEFFRFHVRRWSYLTRGTKKYPRDQETPLSAPECRRWWWSEDVQRAFPTPPQHQHKLLLQKELLKK